MIDEYLEIENNIGGKTETLFEDQFLTLFLDFGLYQIFFIDAQVKLYDGDKYLYRADFILTLKDNPKKQIIIEIDGKHHRFNPVQKIKDYYRDRDLKSSGYDIIRIPNESVKTFFESDKET